jgi:rSAM/selenodomain-associated transferase 1
LPAETRAAILRLVRKLVVFARWPQPGLVKSRLSPALPADLACRLYESMLRDVLEAGRRSSAEERWLDWADPETESPHWDGAEGYRPAAQRGADLGERLEHAIRERLRAPEDRLVVIGADAPELGPATISDAFALLERHELALGPTRDGGYYLLGVSRLTPELFRGVSWGTDQVLPRTLETARARSLRVGTLEPLEDVDTPQDLVRLVIRCLRSPDACPHTVSALRQMGLLPSSGA